MKIQFQNLIKKRGAVPVGRAPVDVGCREHSYDVLCLPGKLEAGRVPFQGHPIGSGQLLKKWRRISSPVTGPSTPATLNRAVAPAGQSHGRSLFPVSSTPVSLHFAHFAIAFLLSKDDLVSSRQRAQISLKPNILDHKSQEAASTASWECLKNFSFLLLQKRKEG